MANLKIFSLVVAILAFVTATSASPRATRINDLVTLNEDTGDLQFDPINGFNETTREPAWQRQYLESLDSHEIIARHYEEHFDHLARQDLTPREARRDLAPREFEQNVQCFTCMLTFLMVFPARTKQYAYGVCYRTCTDATSRGIANNAANYAATAGYTWAAGNQPANNWYNTWAAAPFN